MSLKHGRQIREQADISGLLQRIKYEMKATRTLAVVIAVCSQYHTVVGCDMPSRSLFREAVRVWPPRT